MAKHLYPSKCKFCGADIAWFGGRPFNVGKRGGDHRETCVGLNHGYRNAVRDANHEARVQEFLQAARKGQRKRLARA